MKHTYSLKITSPCTHCQKMPVKHYIFALLAVLMATFSYEVKASHLPIIKIETLTAENSEKPVIPMPPAKNSISGRLFDKATGKPLQLVEVELTYSSQINYYFAYMKKKFLEVQYDSVSIEYLNQLAEEERIATNFAQKLYEKSFVTKTDENGYFILALPDEVPSKFPLKLDIRFVDNKVINSTGDPDKCMINSIGNIKIDYKGGYFYEKMLLNVTRANECNGRIIELLGHTHFDD